MVTARGWAILLTASLLVALALIVTLVTLGGPGTVGTVIDRTVTSGHCSTTSASVGGTVESCVPDYYGLVLRMRDESLTNVRVPRGVFDAHPMGSTYDLEREIRW
mgnify:CR=1 FL=1